MTAITITDLNNAKLDVDHIANVAASTNTTTLDRYGQSKKTVYGAVESIKSMNSRGAWATETLYDIKDLVLESGSWYVCVVLHTSSAAFATDTASKWRLYQGVVLEDLAESDTASKIGYMPYGFGAVATDLQTKGREVVSIRDFGAVGDGSDEYTEILAAWTHCLANGVDLYFPAGTYSSGINNMPFKHPTYPSSSLLDCGNITLYGDGPSTVLMSNSVTGADVLNLYNVKNLHVRNLRVTAILTGFSSAGSNGISIVGGFDNLTFDHIWVEDLPYVPKVDYLDGGKGFSIQTGTPTTPCGTIKASNIFVKNCVYGFDFSPDQDYTFANKPSVTIEGVVEDCYTGVVFGPGETSDTVPTGAASGFSCDAKVINCQRGVVLSRIHGGIHNYYFMSSKSAAQKRLDGSGATWATHDTVVDGLLVQYGNGVKVAATGYVGDVQYKFSVGGAGGGTADGRTINSDFYIDLGGVASIADILVKDTGGNTIYASRFYISNNTTSSALPAGFYIPSLLNTVTKGPNQRLIAPSFVGALSFAYDDGVAVHNTLEREGLTMWFKQAGSSSDSIHIMGAKNHTGAKKFAIRNDGTIAMDYIATMSSVSGVTKGIPIFNIAGVLQGWVPLYSSYT